MWKRRVRRHQKSWARRLHNSLQWIHRQRVWIATVCQASPYTLKAQGWVRNGPGTEESSSGGTTAGIQCGMLVCAADKMLKNLGGGENGLYLEGSWGLFSQGWSRSRKWMRRTLPCKKVKQRPSAWAQGSHSRHQGFPNRGLVFG